MIILDGARQTPKKLFSLAQYKSNDCIRIFMVGGMCGEDQEPSKETYVLDIPNSLLQQKTE